MPDGGGLGEYWKGKYTSNHLLISMAHTYLFLASKILWIPMEKNGVPGISRRGRRKSLGGGKFCDTSCQRTKEISWVLGGKCQAEDRLRVPCLKSLPELKRKEHACLGTLNTTSLQEDFRGERVSKCYVIDERELLQIAWMQFLFDVTLNNSVLLINIKIHPYTTGLE